MAKKKTKPTAKKHTTTKKVLKKQIDEYKDIRMIPRHIAIYLLVVGVLLCLSLILGVSYSIYQVDNTQSESNQITVGCFTINFEDSGTSNTYTNLSITNSYPISTQTALAKTPYTFKVTNTCDYVAKADIAINVLKTSSVTNLATQQGKTIGDLLVTAIKEGNNAISTPVQLSSLTEGTIRTGDTETDVSYILRTEYLEKNQPKTYSLWIWVPEEINGVEVGNEAQALTLYSKIDIYSVATNNTETVSGNNVAYIPDGHESQLKDLTIKGNTENNTNVGHNGTIDIVVSGKNLINLNVPQGSVSNTTRESSTARKYTPNTYVLGIAFNNYFDVNNVSNYQVINNSLEITSKNGYGVGFPLISSSMNNYVISYDASNDVDTAWNTLIAYDSNGNMLDYKYNNNSENNHIAAQYTTPNNTYYLVIMFTTTGNGAFDTMNYSNIQLEHGSTATPYEPYKERRYTIQLKDTNNNTINGLGTNDELKKVNGTWVIDNGTIQTELASTTQDVLNNISIYDGVSNIWVDDDLLISNISATYLN